MRFVGFGNTHIVSLKTYAEHLLEKFGVVVLQRRISCPPTTTGALTSEGEPPSTFIPGRCVPPRFNISAGSPFDLPETRADCLKDGGSGRWKQLEGKACGGIRAEECGESTRQQGTPGTLLAMAESSAVDLHGTAHSVAPTHGNANSI